MNKKIYAKVFELKGSDFCSKEEFELFREKFEKIRVLYYDEDLKRDSYESFRSIIKEIKRAAHNAGLTAKHLKVNYGFDKDGNITLSNDTTFTFNTIVYFMKTEKDSFVITKIRTSNGATLIQSSKMYVNGIEISNPNTGTLVLDEDALDSTNITYEYRVR